MLEPVPLATVAVAEGQCRHWTGFEIGVAVQRHTAMPRIQPHIQAVRVGIGFTRKGVGNGASVQKGHMVDFLERIFDHFPVGLDLSGPRSTRGRQFAKWIAGQPRAQLTQVVPESFLGGRIDINKDKPFPHIHRDRRQAEAFFRQTKEPLFVWHKGEPAVQGIGPPVEFAGEQATGAPAVPGDLIAAVRAHIVKCLHRAIFAADHDDRGIADGQVFHKVIPRTRNLLHPAHIEPHLPKNLLPLSLKLLRGREDRSGQRVCAELRIFIVPSRTVPLCCGTVFHRATS